MMHNKINYIEFPAKDLNAAKIFYAEVFGWSFVDYGPDYCAILNGGLDGGFYQSQLSGSTASGSALVIIFSKDLESTRGRIIASGGTIVKEIFDFPGGRRFHFSDPNGNELAVWAE